MEKGSCHKSSQHTVGKIVTGSLRALKNIKLVRRWNQCRTCKGSGMIIDDGGDSRDCPACDGRGKTEEICVQGGKNE